MNADSRASSHGDRPAAIPVAIVLLALLAVLVAPSLALASSVTDAGEGFPLSVNASDHILIAKLVIEEEEGKSQENIAGPWSIWAGGSSTPLAPLNGGPETKAVALGEPEHSLFLYRLNAAGVAGGTSTITSGFKEGKEHTVHRAAYYTPDGVGHEVPPLHETITNDKGESIVVGALGTGIDEAGDVAGIGVVKVGEHARSRGFFSAGGTSHPSVVGEADGPWTQIFSMNEAGTMFGTVSEMKITETEEGKTEEEPIDPKYVLWKTPGGSATSLNFDAPLAGFPLASDGSVLGYVAGKLMLRAPGGAETEVAGLSKPFAVNSSHVVVGSKSVAGVEHAAVWQAGTVSDLNALLPKGSGWVLSRAVAINDSGDIAGVGVHAGKERVFLFKPEVGLNSSVSGAPSVALPEEGTATEEFTVKLAKPSAETVTVGYETEDGTATVGNDDYTEASGTLTFAPGETTKAVAVQIDHGDGADTEATETYKLRLQATDTTTPAAGAGTATGTVGLPGIAGKLVTGPASGAATPLSPAPGITVQIVGKTTAGAAVSQAVTSDATGAYKASVDPGEYAVTATGVPAGQSAEFGWSPSAKCPGKRKGPTCEHVPVKSANGKVVQSTVDSGYGQRDPQVENIEVVQGTQLKTFDKAGPEIGTPDIGKMKSYEYSGVGLVAKSDTIVRVYAGNNGPGSAQEVAAQLRGYDASSGGLTPLPGGPLTPINGMVDALPAPSFEGERADATATFNFRLPESWTNGKIVLAATVDPAEKFPECAGCRDNDKLALSGINFTDVPPLKFTPMSITWSEGAVKHAPADPTAAVTRTWPFWPLPTNGLIAAAPPVSIDISGDLASVAKQIIELNPYYKTHPLGYNTKSLIGCNSWTIEEKLVDACFNMVADKIFADEKAALGTTSPAAAAPVVGVFDDTGLEFGILGAANDIGGPFSMVPASRPDTIVHEMLHSLGFKHSGCTKPTDEEAWPANEKGQASLVGFGEDRSLSSEGGIGPIYSTAGPARGEGRHDIMSYCRPRWQSTFNWDRLLLRLKSGTAPQAASTLPPYSTLTATTAAAGAAGAGSLVTVTAVNISGKPAIVEVQPGASVESGATPTPYTAVSLDSHGHVTGRASIRAFHWHAEIVNEATAPVQEETMQFELPARNLSTLEILKAGHVLTRVHAPPGRLRLSVAGPSRSVCKRLGPLQLRYRALPAGRFGRVRVLAAVGRRWRTIEVGAGIRTILLPRGSRPKGSSMLRVEYGDGFASVTTAVKLPKGCRAG